MNSSVRDVVRTMLSTTEPDPRSTRAALGGFRVLIGVLWLSNVGWKRPPDFGRDGGSLLHRFVTDAVEHPVLPPYSWVVEHVVLPNFLLFGWTVLVVEATLAALLLVGAHTRLVALIGLAQSVAITLSVLDAPGEWPWSYYFMIAAHLVLFATGAGRYWGLDGVRAMAATPGARAGAVRGLQGWGAVTVLVGALGVAVSAGRPPTAARGAVLGSDAFALELGTFNILSGLLMAGAGVLLVVAARRGLARAALAVAAGAAAATVAVLATTGRGVAGLGGDGGTAAWFLATAVVAAVLAPLLARGDDRPAVGASASHTDGSSA